MNTLRQLITAGLGLALSVGLVSCEKDSTLTPTPLNGARLGTEDEEIYPSTNLPKTYRLTKYGNSTLSYSADGHLQKVTTAVNRGGVAYHTDYTYAPGSIRAASYQGAILVRDETFTLNATGSRCTESLVKTNTGETHWIYTYNPKGQLSSCQNQNSSIGGATYTYDKDGDLIKATVAVTLTESMDITFAYTVPTMDDHRNDVTYPLNLNVPMLPEHDPFLPIFGRSSKHLVKWVYYSPSDLPVVVKPSDQFYSYMIPGDGYVSDRTMSYTFGGSPVEKIHYEYVMATIGLH
ncbi:hypothetical protein [Spirosoma koreense]